MNSTHQPAGRPAAGSPSRRRPRQRDARPRTVRFPLTEEEFDELESAAGRAGLARGAYAAEAALAAAGAAAAPDAPLREALAELICASGLVRRIGVNLNQAVAKLNATGQRPVIFSRTRGEPSQRGTPRCRGGEVRKALR